MQKIIASILILILIQSGARAQTVYADRIFNCGSYYWDKSGITHETSGVYTVASTGEDGEAITYELTLTIDDSYARSSGTGSCSEYQWHELEMPIGWEANSVDMNGAGTIVALGGQGEGDGGQVKVYQWSTSGWTQMGSTLEGLEEGDQFGKDVSLSKSGKYLAVGSPFHTTDAGNKGAAQVYQWNGTDWEMRGSLIESIHVYDELGQALDFNNDGSVLAIGAPACGRINLQLGEVRIYQWTGLEYEQFGESLYEDTGEFVPDNNGTSLALSGDGHTVIFGARFAKNDAFVNLLGGKYLVFDWNGTAWEKRVHFSGYRSSMQLGFSVTISENGQHFASGAMGDRSSAGMIFGNQGVLGEIFSSESGDQMGRSISMNAEGNIMAVGSSGNDDVALSSGKVQVYRFDGQHWNQIGQDLLGTLALELFGFQTELNDAGNILAVGTFGGSSTAVEDMHIYYYGCADEMSTCVQSIVWENAAWSNIDGPADGDIVHVQDDLTLNTGTYLSPGALTISEESQLTVGAGAILEVKGDMVVNGDLTVESGSSFITYENYSTVGVVTFNRNTRYADGRYSFVGSAVKNLYEYKASVFGPIVYRYEEYYAFEEDGLDRWTDASNSNLAEGLGFAVAGQQEIALTGIPNNGEVSVYGTYTEDATSTSNHWGWNLVSNPYGAAIDLDKFLEVNGNIKSFIALWDDHGSNTGRGDDNDYLIANEIGSVNGPNGGDFDGFIGAMQGFLVQMNGSSNRIYFTEDMRVKGNNADDTFFRKKEKEIPKIKLILSEKSGKYSETLIGFPEDATTGFDRKYDATKLKNQTGFNIYSILENQPLAIQGLPLENELMVPIAMDVEESSVVTLLIGDQSALPDGYLVYIFDHQTASEYEMDAEGSMELSVSAGMDQHRLSLVIRNENALSNTISRQQNFIIFTHTDYINVIGEVGQTINYRLINLMGQLMIEEQGYFFNSTHLTIEKSGLNGLYLMQIESENGKEVHKLILK